MGTDGKAGAYDPLAGTGGEVRSDSIHPGASREGGNGKRGNTSAPKKRLVEWLTPKDIFEFQTPHDYHIVGDNFIFRGGMAIIAGHAGVGKSRAFTWLALCGVTQSPWFGMTTHRPFKTMLLQAENDEERLKQELTSAGVRWQDIQDQIRITRIPRFGMSLADREFQDQLRADIAEFRPDVFGIDPWNRCVGDAMQKDYRIAIDGLISILPDKMEDQPCLAIGAHTRKPKQEEKANGRELLNLISGSLILGSAARAAMFLEHASSDETDNRIVCTVAKCNNGLLPKSSGWERASGPFKALPDFDVDVWKAGNASHGAGGHNEKVTASQLQGLLANGPLPRNEAVKKLMALTGCQQNAAYNALQMTKKNRFHDHLFEENGRVGWITEPWDIER